MSVHLDLDEGSMADFGCIECHGQTSHLSMTSTYLVYALECDECLEELVRFAA